MILGLLHFLDVSEGLRKSLILRAGIGYAGSCSPGWLGVRLDYVVMAYGSLCMIKREMLLADRDRFLPTEDVRYVYLDFYFTCVYRI